MQKELEIKLSRQNLGRAISAFIGRKLGFSFFPLRISSSSERFPEEIDIELSDKPITQLSYFPEKPMAGSIFEKTTLTLTKEEILEAISIEIFVFSLGRECLGNYVTSISVNLPKSITFKLQYVLRGSKEEEALHCFDGKLRAKN